MNKKLIEKYRLINLEQNWWEADYEYFMDEMYDKGLDLNPKDITFRGFYSQGDGLSFSASNVDEQLFLEAHGLTEQYPAAYYLAQLGDCLNFWVKKRFSYYENSRCMTAEVETYAVTDESSDELEEAVLSSMVELFDTTERQALEKDILRICRDYADGLYKELQKTYDYLLSDEAVWEAIVANELDEEEAVA